MSIFRRILRTSVFRLSLLYALLFSLIAAIALLSVYKVAENQIQAQIDTRLKLETNLLLENYRKRALTGLSEDINIYNKKEGRPFYIYALIHEKKLDLSQFIPPEQRQQLRNSGRIRHVFASIPLSEIIEYVPKRPTDETVRVLLTLLPGGYQLLVGLELKETQDLLSQLFKASLIAISVIFALSILIGSLMARRMLKRINAVTQTADSIIDGDLSQRIPITTGRDNELDRLTRSLNRMLDRNEELMIGTREVSNNLAHDLRNPLNRIRHRIELAKLENLSGEPFQQFADDTIDDIDSLISTFNALLSIAQIESGAPRKDWSEFNLSTLLTDLAELYEAVAQEHQLHWQSDIATELVLNGNKQLIAQLFTNLLDNAIKYSPTNGTVSLHAQQTNAGKLQITISDQGQGIPPEQHENVFKRLHRLDNARSTEGNGLGLSLVKAVVDLHDAKIELMNNQPGLIANVVFSKN